MLRPSDAHLWVKCPLSGNMLASGEYHATPDPDRPEDVSDARREGTCAHWVADLVFNGHGPASELVGETHSNGWVVDDDMAYHVQNYVDYVCSFGPPTASEMSIQLFGLINGRLDTVSTSDDTIIRIFDFKYGWKLIEAEENWPMLCYGLAVASRQPLHRLELHVFQPRPNHPEGVARVWEISGLAVDGWSQWLHGKAHECFAAPAGHPGSHCSNCPARGSCHALAANVSSQYEMLTDDRMTNPSPAELGAYLTFLHEAFALVKAKLDGIESEVTARIKRGTMIPRWALEPRHGNRRFTVDTDRVKLATGIDPVKSVPMSPAEVEKAGVPKHVVNAISERPYIGRKLTNNPEALAKRLFANG